MRCMNRQLWLLTFCQGLFLTNNVTFIAINGLVGLALAAIGVIAAGASLRKPLTRLPETELKWGVGVLLSAFGLFFAALLGATFAVVSAELMISGLLPAIAGLALLSLNAWISSRKVLRASPALTLRDSV